MPHEVKLKVSIIKQAVTITKRRDSLVAEGCHWHLLLRINLPTACFVQAKDAAAACFDGGMNDPMQRFNQHTQSQTQALSRRAQKNLIFHFKSAHFAVIVLSLNDNGYLL